MNTSLFAPSLLLGLLVSIGIASVFHLWRGRTMADLALFLVVAVVGFGVGQLAGTAVRVPWLQIGEIHLIEATVGALLALGLANLVLSPVLRR